MKRIFMFTVLGGGGIVVAISSIFAVATQDYAISVDPIKDNQYLFNTARVTITNTGKLPLTDVVINYGGKIKFNFTMRESSTLIA